MPISASRLFHTIVVVGASVGCASKPGESVPADSGGAGPSDAGDASTGPSVGPSLGPQQCQPADGTPGPCSVCDCQRPGEFRCAACASGGTPIDGRCPDNDGLGCLCDTSIAIAGPSDCPDPAQLVCDPPPPLDASLFIDVTWYAFARCHCDPARPTTPSQCADERTTLHCEYGWCLADAAGGPLSDVGYACACIPLPVPIAVAP